MKPLTKPQREELVKLSRGPQNTFGSSRARVQQTLYNAGLAAFANEDGSPFKDIEEADRCLITEAGKLALKV